MLDGSYVEHRPDHGAVPQPTPLAMLACAGAAICAPRHDASVVQANPLFINPFTERRKTLEGSAARKRRIRLTAI
jgi:hypothetical protein